MRLGRLFCLLLFLSVSGAVAETSLSSVEGEMQRADRLVQTISLAEFMGPMAPLALSPFFGLTCLSGSALLVEQGVLPENRFLASSEALHHPGVFGVLLLLTLISSIPRFTKVSKIFAQAVDQVESYAVLIVWLTLFYFATRGGLPGTEDVVVQAGLFSFSADLFLMMAMVLNLVVINSVKFFFEMLILLSPIPAVDAFFEIVNKITVALLIAVYAFSPFAAFVLNLLIFLVCLVVFNTARRRIRYYRMLLFGFIGRPLPVRNGCIEVFPRQAVGAIKKLAHCRLAKTEAGLVLIQPRLLGEDRREALEGAGRMEATWLLHRLTVGEQSFDFSRRYRDALPDIAAGFDCALPEKEKAPRPSRREALKELKSQI